MGATTKMWRERAKRGFAGAKSAISYAKVKSYKPLGVLGKLAKLAGLLLAAIVESILFIVGATLAIIIAIVGFAVDMMFPFLFIAGIVAWLWHLDSQQDKTPASVEYIQSKRAEVSTQCFDERMKHFIDNNTYMANVTNVDRWHEICLKEKNSNKAAEDVEAQKEAMRKMMKDSK